MKFLSSLFCFLAVFLFSFPTFAAQKDKTPKKEKEIKTHGRSKGYEGDPAIKRGYELGYDYGFKSGKLDKKEGRKLNPAGSEGYKSAEKKYRHEYGNFQKFLTGYHAGFVKAYKLGFSKEKIDVEASKKAKKKDLKETKEIHEKQKEKTKSKSDLSNSSSEKQKTHLPQNTASPIESKSNPPQNQKSLPQEKGIQRPYNPSEDAL